MRDHGEPCARIRIVKQEMTRNDTCDPLCLVHCCRDGFTTEAGIQLEIDFWSWASFTVELVGSDGAWFTSPTAMHGRGKAHER